MAKQAIPAIPDPAAQVTSPAEGRLTLVKFMTYPEVNPHVLRLLEFEGKDVTNPARHHELLFFVVRPGHEEADSAAILAELHTQAGPSLYLVTDEIDPEKHIRSWRLYGAPDDPLVEIIAVAGDMGKKIRARATLAIPAS